MSMRELTSWFKENKRAFPWRENPTPYSVWVSEIMLQQTRASVVVPYFLNWMVLFPDIETLARAPLEKVIKAWEGLGYYSRARNLHKGAKEIVAKFGGEVPKDPALLESISGIGPYTKNAILSFAYQKRVAAVDGNVTRVIARLFALKENVSLRRVQKKIQEGADAILDSEEPWVSSEALIELGATVCTPKPFCEHCPLKGNCLGKEIAEALPIKNPSISITKLYRAVFVIECGGKVLLKRPEKKKVMADLHEFPYIEMGKAIWPREKLFEKARETFGINLKTFERLKELTHSFTRYKAKLFPYKGEVFNCFDLTGHYWEEKKRLDDLAFSSGHRRVLLA